MSHPFVIVVWDDAYGGAHTPTAEADMAAGHTPLVVQTIGWLLRDDDKGISLFNERYDDEGTTLWRGRSFIPRGMIRSVTPFNLSRPRRKPNVQTTSPE
jgi:hypothetical protein